MTTRWSIIKAKDVRMGKDPANEEMIHLASAILTLYPSQPIDDNTWSILRKAFTVFQQYQFPEDINQQLEAIYRLFFY